MDKTMIVCTRTSTVTTEDITFGELLYVLGRDPPRFPVPAPRLENNELNRAVMMAYRRRK